MTAPYGSWASPVTVDLMTSASVGLGAPQLSDGNIFWLESRADEEGRTSLWRQSPTGHPDGEHPDGEHPDGESPDSQHSDACVRTQLTPAPFYVRSMVHEYGGGAWDVSGDVAVFSHLGDGRLYRVIGDGAAEPITPANPDHRLADIRVHPDRNLVLAIREDHSASLLERAQDKLGLADGPTEAVASIVAYKLSGDNEDGGIVLRSGADFYSTPELSTDSRLAWTEWDHPSMPWDSTRLMTGHFTGTAIEHSGQVAGGPDESAVQPRWTPSGKLIFVSDRSNWWNLYAWTEGSVQPLHQAEAEFAGPQWMLGQKPYAVVDDDHLLCRWTSDGTDHLGLLDLSTHQMREYETDAVTINSIHVEPVGPGKDDSPGRLAVLSLGYPDRPGGLATLDIDAGTIKEFRRSSDVELPDGVTSIAQQVSWETPTGTVYGLYYPPTNPDFDGPEGELPPLITHSHGGPTVHASAAFDAEYQYWTSRGFAMLDVNYGGSTTFGREYRNRLQGAWGVVDVEDCAAGARAMAEQGLADPRRLAMVGGSAGGYTTLRALTTTDVFTAGISLYGIGDLEALAKDTHKFESRYPDGLVGPYPEARAVYQDRSPINHVDKLSCPILLIQGREDKVVPPNQSIAFADAARTKGLPVGLLIFEDEGHGFRKAENIRASIEAQLYFLGKVFAFTPADALTAYPIDNLPSRTRP